MTWGSPKGSNLMNHYPKTLSRIAVSVGGLAMFLLFASWVLVSFPIGSTVSGYFYGIDSLQKLEFSNSLGNQTPVVSPLPNNVDITDKNAISESNSGKNRPSDSNSEVATSSNVSVVVSEAKDIKDPADVPVVNEKAASEKPFDPPVPSGSSSSSVDANVETADKNFSNESKSQVSLRSTTPSIVAETKEGEDIAKPALGITNVTEVGETEKRVSVGPEPNDTASSSSDAKSGSVPATSHLPNNATSSDSVDSGCDLYRGSWFYDSSGPQYTNNTCPVLTQMQNCQGNGRPDKEYENWRWKPLQCDLPRFDAKKFLELMRGKTIAFIGDSVARNHMESLLCILWQAIIYLYYDLLTNTFIFHS